MTTREKAPTILTAEGARRLTARIRDALALADDLLVRACEGRAWEALGHGSWAAYVEAELPELRMMKLRKEARQQRAKALRDAGASIPEIVAATGSSLGAIHRDLNPKPFQMETPDGRHRPINPRTRPGSVSESRADQIVRLVAAAGIGGLTVQELCAEAGLHHGQASGGLSRVHRQGRVVRTEVYRNGCAAYTV